MITKPLLAATAELEKINFPVLATPKLDGIRAMMIKGKLVSRTFKPIPNNFVRNTLEKILPDGIDGEVMLRDPRAPFQQVTSAVMGVEGEPDFVYHAFDYVKKSLDTPYDERIEDLVKFCGKGNKVLQDRVHVVVPSLIDDLDTLTHYEEVFLLQGYEGVMIRAPKGRYKCGRSTLKEGTLLKVKRFIDSEATILSFEEKMTNQNAADKDNFGRTKRSSKKEGLVPAGTLGALNVKDINSGIEFSIGSGFDDAIRKEIWANQKKYKGKLVKYKSQPIGVKEAPRFPVFLGFRHAEDM